MEGWRGKVEGWRYGCTIGGIDAPGRQSTEGMLIMTLTTECCSHVTC